MAQQRKLAGKPEELIARALAIDPNNRKALALSATARQTVDDIERALARMANGTYGLCVSCGDRIPVARLEVIPWAEQCVKCKARGERRR